MPLRYVGSDARAQPYFPPDRIDHVRHDARPDENMVVYDRNGVAVWGRQVDGATGTWRTVLDDWEWTA